MKSEHKKLYCKFLEVKFDDSDDEFFRFEGHAAVFDNVDRGNDVIKKGAFKKSIAALKKNSVEIVGTNMVKLMPILWQHDPHRPLGSFVEIKEDDRGLFVKGIMPKSDTFVSGTVIPQLRAYSVSDMSIGFITVESSFDKDVRVLEEITLFEASLVTIPMNPEANITTMKKFDFIEKLNVAEKNPEWSAKEFTLNTDDLTDDQIEQCMPWGDEGKSLADVIDGQVTIIPEAVFYAALCIHVKSDGDEDIRENIEYCYKRMKLDSPYKKTTTFRIDNFKHYSERELESLLKSGVTFSQSMAKRLVNALSDVSQRDAGNKSCQWDAELKAKLEQILKSLNEGGQNG